MILLALVIPPVVATVMSLRQVPLYEASAEVLLRHQTLASSLSGIEDPSIWQDPTRIAETQTEVARVPLLARRVLRAAELPKRDPGAFLASSSVEPKSNTDVLRFRVRDAEPELAVRLASAYAREFKEYRAELDSAALVHARKELESRIRELERAGDRRSGSYARTLVNRAEQLRTMEVLEGSRVILLRRAQSAVQIQPKPVRNAVLGVVLGLILAVGVALLGEALDSRVRSGEEIGERLGLPLLARLGEPPRRLRRNEQLAMLVDPNGRHAEAFRMLRANVEFANLEREARTIMVTSAFEQEGKSTTIANLAVAFARAGRHVVLVDLDLRRPFLARFFDLEAHAGLTDVALGDASLEEATARVPLTNGRQRAEPAAADHVERLDDVEALKVKLGRWPSGNGYPGVDGILEVIPSGPVPPDPGEFVGTAILSKILGHLSQRAELVLLDAPPLLHVGDAMTLSAKVDAMFVVARLSLSRRGTLNEVARLLDSSPAAKLGFVLAGARPDDPYGYGGAYYYEAPQRSYQEQMR